MARATLWEIILFHWQASDRKPGYVALPVPQDVGILQVVLGVYDPGTGLSVGDWVELGEVAE